LLHYLPVETHLLESRQVAQTFKIQVARPPQTRGSAATLPVVYVTDGNAVFDIFKGITWLLQGFRRDLDFILVAIGYPAESPYAGEVLRGRDLTFPGCPNFFHGLTPPWDDVDAPVPGTKDFCGAEDFQRFLELELFPLIDATYQTVPGDRSYFGHSLGGAFGLFTLFTQAHLFRNYVISSPAVLYHGATPDGTRYDNHGFLLNRAQEFIAAQSPLRDIKLYLSVGAEEEFEPSIANWQFVSGFYRLATMLREASIPGLVLSTETFPGETHTTAWPIAFMHGVRAVFHAR
jgi:predicted alpha/beta superfamily hydrolase